MNLHVCVYGITRSLYDVHETLGDDWYSSLTPSYTEAPPSSRPVFLLSFPIDSINLRTPVYKLYSRSSSYNLNIM